MHTPDKACESFFGYISCLPGAYSMYRWNAIKGEPMDQFFKLVNSEKDPTCVEANEYLAEDRVMCLQIYIKEKAGYFLTYVPDAKGFTDAPENLTTLIKQRRRWNNGSVFVALRVIKNFFTMTKCYGTGHSIFRQLGMISYLIYFSSMWAIYFFNVSTFYLSIKHFFIIFARTLTDTESFKESHHSAWKFFND